MLGLGICLLPGQLAACCTGQDEPAFPVWAVHGRGGAAGAGLFLVPLAAAARTLSPLLCLRRRPNGLTQAAVCCLPIPPLPEGWPCVLVCGSVSGSASCHPSPIAL